MAAFSMDHREDWLWTMLIAQPPVVTADLVADAVAAAVRKGNAPSAEGLRLEVLDQGDAAQVMHHGPTPARRRPSRRCTRSSPTPVWCGGASTTRCT